MARFIDMDEEGEAAGNGDPGAVRREELARHFAKWELQSSTATSESARPETDQSSHEHAATSAASAIPDGVRGTSAKAKDEGGEQGERPKMVQNVITEAFQCYPITIGIVSLIDINTLDSLALTCQTIHSGLIQYRSILLASTLRCSNEDCAVDPDQVLRFRARAGIWEDTWEMKGRVGGKSGQCARDMVRECRRCGVVVCRNCTIKPPSPATLRERHRRLCITCSRVPLSSLSSCPGLSPAHEVAAAMIKESICQCTTQGVYLCQPCGKGIRAEDMEYRSIWRWRNQYGEVLGGLGTGIGDGDRGVICGRGVHCLAAKERAHEVDCDAEDAKHPFLTPDAATTAVGSTTTGSTAVSVRSYPRSHDSTPNHVPTANPIGALASSELWHQATRTPSPQVGPGYERHEIEGIGGVVKTKLLRMVRVGACVPEWGDEQQGGVPGGRSLRRETEGSCRSWCGWCWRVIPGPEDEVS